jgi:hypothetical protein
MRPPASPAAHTPKRVDLGSPRWPRPDSLQRVNVISSYSIRSIFVFRRILFSLYVRGLARRSRPPIQGPDSRVSERRRNLLQCFNRPWALSRASDPGFSAGARPPPKRLPQQGISADSGTRRPRCRARSGRTPSPLHSPFHPAPTLSSPTRDHRSLGHSDIVRTDRGFSTRRPVRQCLPPSTCARPEPPARPTSRERFEMPFTRSFEDP